MHADCTERCDESDAIRLGRYAPGEAFLEGAVASKSRGFDTRGPVRIRADDFCQKTALSELVQGHMLPK